MKAITFCKHGYITRHSQGRKNTSPGYYCGMNRIEYHEDIYDYTLETQIYLTDIAIA